MLETGGADRGLRCTVVINVLFHGRVFGERTFRGRVFGGKATRERDVSERVLIDKSVAGRGSAGKLVIRELPVASLAALATTVRAATSQ